MPAKSLIIAYRADKELSKLPIQIQKKFLMAFESLKQNPISGIILHGELSEYCKFRVGDYRVIYSFDSILSIVHVVKIEHRQGVYK